MGQEKSVCEALQCPSECDFLIAVCGHDTDVISAGLDAYDACPNCGEDVPDKARACPHCGSDENTGWSEMTYLDGIDLGDESDYEETLGREGLSCQKSNPQNRIWGFVVGLVVFLFILRFVLRLF